MKKNFFSLFKGFSLIELLISLIVISVIAAGFAPIMTKKIKMNSIALNNSKSEQSSQSCPIGQGLEPIENVCAPCPKGTYSPNDKSTQCAPCPENQYQDEEGASSCKTCASYQFPNKEKNVCINCVEVYGYRCLTCNKNQCLTYCTNDKTPRAKNGTCTALTLGEPQSELDCELYDAAFIPAKYNGAGGKNLCVTKYNAGDYKGPNIIGVTGITINAPTAACTTGKCCWFGNTTDMSQCGDWGNSDSTYSGCNRTVCQWNAAQTACSFVVDYPKSVIDANDGRATVIIIGGGSATNGAGDALAQWRLPTKEEAQGWASVMDDFGSIFPERDSEQTPLISRYKGSKGLQICAFGSSGRYGSVDCTGISNYCKYNSTICGCMPYYIWTSSAGETKNYYQAIYNHLTVNRLISLTGGGGTTGVPLFSSYVTEISKFSAASVRCVTDQVYR